MNVFAVSYWLLAVSYIILGNFMQYPLDFIHKAMPALLLCLWIKLSDIQHKPLAILALLFCACGDMILALDFTLSFVAGLGAFLTGHLFFTLLFHKWWFWTPRKILVLLLLLAAMLNIGMLIIPATGAFLLPVSLYILVITAMAMSAVLAAKDSMQLIFGALVFMLSDTLIGLNKFFAPVPYEHIAIMLTYYLALFLLTTGIIKRGSND